MALFKKLFPKGNEKYLQLVIVDIDNNVSQRFVLKDLKLCENEKELNDLFAILDDYELGLNAEIINKEQYALNNVVDIANYGYSITQFVDTIKECKDILENVINQIEQAEQNQDNNDKKIKTKKDLDPNAVMQNTVSRDGETIVTYTPGEYKKGNSQDMQYQ